MNPILKLQMTDTRQSQMRAQAQSSRNNQGIHSQVAKAYEFAQDVREARNKRAHSSTSQGKMNLKDCFTP